MMFAKRMLFLLVCSVPIFSAAAADSLMEAQYRNFAYPPAIPAEIRANIGSNTAAFLADLKQTLAAEKENLLVLAGACAGGEPFGLFFSGFPHVAVKQVFLVCV